jgi:acyl carrier protein
MYDMLAKLLIEEFGISADKVYPNANLRSLDLDSFLLAELAVIVEEKTGLNVMAQVELDVTLQTLADTIAAGTTTDSAQTLA